MNKKYLVTFLFFLLSMLGKAQICNTIEYLDKFDDTLKFETRKTLIFISDTTIVFEEKGKKPVTYYIVLNEIKEGSQDSIVCLTKNVYGYQTNYTVVREKLYEDYLRTVEECEGNSNAENLSRITRLLLSVTHRVVTSQYTGEYIDEFFWIGDIFGTGLLGKDINRIIYTRE